MKKRIVKKLFARHNAELTRQAEPDWADVLNSLADTIELLAQGSLASRFDPGQFVHTETLLRSAGEYLKDKSKASHAEAEKVISREDAKKIAELITKGYRDVVRESYALEKEIRRITDTCRKDDLVNWLRTRAELCGLCAEDLIGKNMMYLLAMIFWDPIMRNMGGSREHLSRVLHGTANLTQKERDQVSRITGGRVVFEKEVEG